MSDSCNAMDCSPPGSSVPGVLQARILEWVAISFPGDLPDPGIEPGSPALQADDLLTELLMMYLADISKSVESLWPSREVGSPLTEVSLPPTFFFTYPLGP